MFLAHSGNRRVLRTKQAIHDAVYSLIQESHGLKLSVSEVLKRANINRKTFYARYDTIDDALRAVVDDEIARLCEELMASTQEGGIYELNRITLMFLQLIDTSALIGNRPHHDSDDLVRMLSMVRATFGRHFQVWIE